MPRPRILVSAHTEPRSSEFPDDAISLSRRYTDAILAAGGLPLVLAPTPDVDAIRQAVNDCDGVLLSGGEDVDPKLYRYQDELPSEIQARVVPAVGSRDLFELVLIDEVLRQSRPLLAICRGQQIVNVALGGDLIADLEVEVPDAPGHTQCERRFDAVHEVVVVPGSRFAAIAGVERFGVNSTHHQAVGRVAPPLRVVGRSPDGIIEALELDSTVDPRAHELFFLTVQFHPERLHDRHPVPARILQSFVEACRTPPPR